MTPCKEDNVWFITVFLKPLTVHWGQKAKCLILSNSDWIAWNPDVRCELCELNTADPLLALKEAFKYLKQNFYYLALLESKHYYFINQIAYKQINH